MMLSVAAFALAGGVPGARAATPVADSGEALAVNVHNGQFTPVAPASPLHVLAPAVHEVWAVESYPAATARGRLQLLKTDLLYVYLRMRLAEPGPIAAVDEALTQDLMFAESIGSPALDPRQRLEAVRARWGWDAAVYGEWIDDRFVFHVLMNSGVRTWQGEPGDGILVLVRGAAGLLGECLGLDADARDALADPRLPSDAMFIAVYQSFKLPGDYKYNMGERRLDTLGPFLQEAHHHPDLAHAFMNAGLAVRQDWERTRRDIRNAQAIAERLRLGMLSALGVQHEPKAWALCRNLVIAGESFVPPLVALTERGALDPMDEMFEQILEAAPDDRFPTMKVDSPATLLDKPSPDRIAGAIRCLAVLRPDALKPLFPKLAAQEDVRIRRAAAFALSHHAPESVAHIAPTLHADPDVETAFRASLAAWQAEVQGMDKTALAAARMWLDRHDLDQIELPDLPGLLARTLAKLGDATDNQRLRRLAACNLPEARAHAVGGLMRLNLAASTDLAVWLRSGSTATTQVVLERMTPERLGNDVQAAVLAVAGSPHAALADYARTALRHIRPDDLRGAMEYDLAVESFYRRWQRLADLRTVDAPWRDEVLLETAMRHRCPQTRAQALHHLAETAPERTAEPIRSQVADAHLWVRLHAAALAARHPDPRQADALLTALENETDPAIRLYLQDALARLDRAPPPAPQRAARRFGTERISFGSCYFAGGDYDLHSAIDYYYLLNGFSPREELHPWYTAALQKGKRFHVRTNRTARNPLDVLFDLRWHDRWWSAIVEEFAQAEWLDGITLGEETMYFKTTRWEQGWREFCMDARLDPERVRGDRENLSESESRAFEMWEDERIIDGFNRICDFLHLYYGRLYPGLEVSTYVPSNNAPRPRVSNRRWRFDVAGEYYYASTNHYRYNAIRRLATMWPKRPVKWLIWPRVETYPGDSWGHPGFRYDSKRIPGDVFPTLDAPAYTQSVTAWLAGADPGYFSFFGFAHPTEERESVGYVWLPNLKPDDQQLERTVRAAFAGVEQIYRLRDDMETLEMTNPLLDAEKSAQALLALFGKDDESVDPYAERVEREIRRTILGYALEGKMIRDVSRVLAGLPRPRPSGRVLWLGGTHPLQASDPNMQHVSTENDYLESINRLAEIPLEDYRLIGIHNQADGLLLEAAVQALSQWVREQPGVLLVLGRLQDDPEARQTTPDDLAPMHQAMWPWQKDVLWQKDRYRASTDAAVPIELGDAPALLWRRENHAGAVLFIAPKTHPQPLQKKLDLLRRKHGLGVELREGHGYVYQKVGDLEGVSVIGKEATPVRLAGFDLLTGMAEPTVTHGAAIVTEHYIGPFVAVLNGVHVLCERKIEAVEAVENGLRLQSPGLIQASSRSPRVRIQGQAGDLPEVAEEHFFHWLFEDTIGVIRRRRPHEDGVITFIRTGGAEITITSE